MAPSMRKTVEVVTDKSTDKYEREFERFIQDFGKSYVDAADRARHFEAFRANMLFIEEHNKQDHSYHLGITSFADITADDFGARYGMQKALSADAQNATNLWQGLPYLGEHEVDEVQTQHLDWRSKDAVTDVKNQGKCGGCWAFSATGAIEGAWKIATGQLVSLSEQQFIDCDTNEMGCNGGVVERAFTYASTAHLCMEESYAYQAAVSKCASESFMCTVGVPSGGVMGFKDVRRGDEKALMSAIQKQPVSVAIEADQSLFQLYKGGVLTGACGVRIDHGVLLVGYGTDKGTDYWLIKNSWGSGWGESGYVRIARNTNECGIASQATYPVVDASKYAGKGFHVTGIMFLAMFAAIIGLVLTFVFLLRRCRSCCASREASARTLAAHNPATPARPTPLLQANHYPQPTAQAQAVRGLRSVPAASAPPLAAAAAANGKNGNSRASRLVQ